jgi:2-polyprenyl-3-methyl-5-hydroxy-6-metoxy-1,4-benzoquinol methylase
MQYDPVKRIVGKAFNQSSLTRILFYKLLDLLLLRAWYIKREIRKFRQIKGEKANILDAGAGFGQYTYYLSSLSSNWEIKAVDINKEQIKNNIQFFSKRKFNNKVSFEEANLVNYKKITTYDLILSIDVMEHILEDDIVFRNLYQSLKPDGLLLISTPSDQGGSDVHSKGEVSFIQEHVRKGYNIIELKKKLLTAGFSEVDAFFTYGTPGKISWKISMKYPILLIGIHKLFFLFLPFYYLITFPFSCILNWIDVNKMHKTGTGLVVKAWK